MAPQLPTIVEHRQTFDVVWTGADLLLAGYKNDTSINPEEKYVIDCPLWIHTNHEKEMKKLYYKSGKQAVIDYVAATINKAELCHS